MPTMIDFFCGGGGVGLGFKKAGFNILQAFDWDKYAVQSYKHNVGPHVQQQDIFTTNSKEIAPADIWTFGFSCQDITKMGAQAGITGERSRTFFEIMRLLKTSWHKPKMLIAENVDGLDEFFPIIEQHFEENGYSMYTKFIASVDYGVAQNRKRWFIVGIQDCLPQTFQFPKMLQNPRTRLIDFLESDVPEKYYMKEQVAFDNPFMSEPNIQVIGRLSHKGPDVTKRVYNTSGLAPTLTASGGGHRQPKIVCPVTGRIRKLTPREYFRLQGFPDSYEIVVSDTQAYKIAGNAVTVNVAEAMAGSIAQYIQSIGDTSYERNAV